MSRYRVHAQLAAFAMCTLCAAVITACRTAPPAVDTSADARVVFDRLHAERNVSGIDLSALNAVGVVAPVDYAARRVYATGSGFLIDACHVLTAEHVMYGWQGDYDTAPALGQEVQFALGQVDAGEPNPTEGLKFFYQGTVTAHGGTGRHAGRTDHSDSDWALVTLSKNVERIRPLALYPLDPLDNSQANWISGQHGDVGTAGFPGDHMNPDPALAHEHLWGSFGSVMQVAYDPASGYASMSTTNPATAGTSGGVVFTWHADRIVAVGIVQSVVGDGIHDKQDQPTVAVLITPKLLTEIDIALARTPCSPGG